MSDRMSSNLAANLRRLREVRGLTQVDLAELSDVPRPTLAHLESGTANPTLNVLVRVADALQTALDELIGAPRRPVVCYPAGTLPKRVRGGVSVQQLLPDRIPGTSIERLELAPGARVTVGAGAVGTRRYVACEAGELELRTADEMWRLHRGDLLALGGESSHVLFNRGRNRAVAYSVVAPAPLAQ